MAHFHSHKIEHDGKSRAIHVGTDNICSDNRSDSDSESVSDSLAAGRQRRPRVGLRGGSHRHYTLTEKLAARTTRTPTCWVVDGFAVGSGHIQITSGSRDHRTVVYAHRLAWEMANGRAVPAGYVVMHACDNPRCVNPAHLSIGTQRDNIIDSIHKGRYGTWGIQKLNAAQVLAIRRRASEGETHAVLARAYGIARNTVSGIVNRVSWRHLEPQEAAQS